MKKSCIAALAISVGLCSQAAWAVDETTLATARDLGQQGLNAYDAGHYDEAAQKLLAAYGAIKVPTFARNAARALAKQGKLVAAAELYLQATRLEPNELWRGDLQQQAQREAAVEREQLLARIARLRVVIDGASSKNVILIIDGTVVPSALIDAEQFADPGKRRVSAQSGTQVVESSIELKEGEHGKLVLRFAASAEKAGPDTHASNKSKGLRQTLGWVGVSTGAAAVTVGAVTGIIALNKKSQLQDAGCFDNVCHDLSQQGKMDSYNSLLTVSSIGFIAGGALAATGVTLLLWPDRSAPKPNAALVLLPSALAIKGRF